MRSWGNPRAACAGPASRPRHSPSISPPHIQRTGYSTVRSWAGSFATKLLEAHGAGGSAIFGGAGTTYINVDEMMS
jgi:hypothetical protein